MARAEEAQRLLDGPIFREAWAEAEAKVIRAWEQAESTAVRESCWSQLQGIKLMRKELTRIIKRGEYAAGTSPKREEPVE
jgi:hypothetical protein